MMMRARRVVTTIARRASMSLGVAVAVTMAQAVTLTATYSTAPEARGPRRGVIGFEDEGGDDDDGGGRRPVISRWMTTRSIGSGGRDDGERSRSRRRRRLVAFVAGDSTACGVGCASAYETPTPTERDEDDTKGEGVRRARDGGGGDEDEEIGGRGGRFLGPTLARAFAARASERLRADVEWRALGFKGADVRGLRDKLIPALREAMRGDDGDEGAVDGSVARGTTPDAVVIMCGINDAKRVVVGRTSANFRAELRQLVEEVRAVVGDECVVVLPATPIEAATLFPPPLVWVATRMNDLWDEQKAHVSALTKNVVFVTKPSLDSLRQSASEATGRVADTITLICGDGIHPNDVGYDAWARHIADACVPSLRRALAEGESP
jgi:lysophospholipase L1-like esterase